MLFTKGESGQSWPRLTKERAKLNWLSVDFNNWKDWEDDSDEDMSNFDRFSEMMNNMGGDEDVDLPEVDGADDDSQDSDDEKCQIWNKEYCHHLDFEKVISLQNFIIERIPELIALKVDAVFASFNPFFNLFVF